MEPPNWNGQNIPVVYNKGKSTEFSILPVLEFLLDYDEDSIYDFLPSPRTYGWNDELMNTMAWANNAYRVMDYMPDFYSYGGVPSWFPYRDQLERPLSPQGRVDRFLYYLDLAYQGLPENHREANPQWVVNAILELVDDMGSYMGEEEADPIDWELEEEHAPPRHRDGI